MFKLFSHLECNMALNKPHMSTLKSKNWNTIFHRYQSVWQIMSFCHPYISFWLSCWGSQPGILQFQRSWKCIFWRKQCPTDFSSAGYFTVDISSEIKSAYSPLWKKKVQYNTHITVVICGCFSFVIPSVAGPDIQLHTSLQLIGTNWAAMICPDEDHPLDLMLIKHPHKREHEPFVKCFCFQVQRWR